MTTDTVPANAAGLPIAEMAAFAADALAIRHLVEGVQMACETLKNPCEREPLLALLGTVNSRLGDLETLLEGGDA